jgi:hypothetical protein
MFKSPIRSTTMIIIQRARRPLAGKCLPRRKLTGRHCQCTGCGEFFNSESPFNDHRLALSCLTRAEMLSRGMRMNSGGWWVIKKLAYKPALLFEESAIASGALPYQGSGPRSPACAPREMAEELTPRARRRAASYTPSPSGALKAGMHE